VKTEDKIKGAADKRDKRRDQEFADAVIDILRETHKGDGYLSGSASSPEARLAAILAFLQAQAREVLARLIHRALSAVVFRLMASGIARLF